MSWAYYNECDPFAARWLDQLIAEGHVAPGDVDTRSIEDVTADDLRGYSQHHFFAGIGIWSTALRAAGWPDDRPVWTGSCPCQPFSAAGKGGGFDDERHLWPAWFWLLDQHRPEFVFGEQVAAKPGLAWFDLVSSDLEGAGYACGAVDTCAAGVGAPHIRQRLYWMGVADRDRSGARRRHDGEVPGLPQAERQPVVSTALSRGTSGTGAMVDAASEQARLLRRAWEPGSALADGSLPRLEVVGEQHARPERPAAERGGAAGDLADADGGHACAERQQRSGEHGQFAQDGEPAGALQHAEGDGRIERRPESGWRCVAGGWREADWIACRDGKWRPVEPGTFPLAHGAPARVGRLRGYGNGLVLPQAAAFVEAAMTCLGLG